MPVKTGVYTKNESMCIPAYIHAMTGKDEEGQVFTVFDDQEIPYAVLNSALGRLTKILDQPLAGKETFPAIKLKKEQVDFFVNFSMFCF